MKSGTELHPLYIHTGSVTNFNQFEYHQKMQVIDALDAPAHSLTNCIYYS
jgi:hypothetical protein